MHPTSSIKTIGPCVCFLLLLSCDQPPEDNYLAQPETPVTQHLFAANTTPGQSGNFTPAQITFQKLNNRGILLGKELLLLDSALVPVKDISNYDETVVDITAASDSFFKDHDYDDYCQAFRYVRIKTKNFEGIIDGRQVYAFDGKRPVRKQDDILFTTTSNFGVGATDEHGLTYCSVNNPAVLTIPEDHYTGTVQMLKNDYYKSDYPYFELKQDDMAYDSITHIKEEGEEWKLYITRTYQEGVAHFVVELRKKETHNYVAEIMNEASIAVKF